MKPPHAISIDEVGLAKVAQNCVLRQCVEDAELGEGNGQGTTRFAARRIRRDGVRPHWQVSEVELAAAVDTIPENALVAVGLRIKIGDPRHAADMSISILEAGAKVTENMQSQLQVAPPQLHPSVLPSKVFDTYWRFAAERQEVFFRRLAGAPPPWTADPILREFKFTNAYRASDRVSQYLIKRVIYAGDQNPDELIFRILVFKMFNRIETWELLEESLGGISLAAYDFDRYDSVLTNAMAAGARIYSAAYIMPSGGRNGDGRKHRDHLRLIERMMRDSLATQLRRCKSMHQGFQILKAYPMVGDFLAYQFITDINYSTLTYFSEVEFTVPGPGARDGIRKCFESIGELSPADVIRMMADIQDQQFARLGFHFRSLWGRPLQLVDCQNLFCEVSKYARCAHPDVGGLAGRTRIKQRSRMDPRPLSYWYPPKWNINHLHG